MIFHQLALVKREIWEHRSIWLTPAVIAIFVTLGTLMALMYAGEYSQELDIALFGAQNITGEVGEAGRKAVLSGLFFGSSGLFLLALGILIIFYSLDSLYAERKDKSILFWRSLPVTDAETVVSKLITALLVIPAASIIAIIGTHLINLIVTSIWVSMKGGDAGLLIWSSVPLMDNWLSLFIIVYAATIWMSPFVGWFLFVSAYTKRSPILMAFLPLVLIPMLEGIFLHTNEFARVVWGRLALIPIHSGLNIDEFFDDENFELNDQMVSVLAQIDLGRFVTSPSVWAGVLVCGLLSFGAIYIRRFRDES
jgi:ABC-2 type transport system permease protein